MERTLTVEEKIRRAEEIYERRKQGETRPIAKVNVNEKKDIKLIKKMLIQILICVAIYLIIYTVQNSQYVFSNDFIQKVNEILSYDTNFVELYENVKNQIMNFMNINNNEGIGGAEETTEQIQEEQKEGQPTQEQNTNPQTEQMENQTGEQPVENNNTANLSQEEIDIMNIKNTTTFIKPIQGVISSKYGRRDTATGSVPKNHTGTDIAANLGTKIVSATDGEVVLSSEEGDYRKTFKNSNW